ADTLEQLQVRAVDAAGHRADQHVVGPRARARELARLERAAEGGQQHGLHLAASVTDGAPAPASPGERPRIVRPDRPPASTVAPAYPRMRSYDSCASSTASVDPNGIALTAPW